MALDGVPHLSVEATSTVNLETNILKAGLSFTLIGGCQFVVPHSAIDKINGAANGLRKYAVSSSAEVGPPTKPEEPPQEPIDAVVDIAPHVVALFEAIKEIDEAKKKNARQRPS